MAVSLLTVGVTAVCAFVLLRLLSGFKNAGRPQLPPGPKGLPLIGNLSDMPPPGVLEAHHWLKHKELYGPISSVTILGQTIVIVNDVQIAIELLEKRSAKHSSRPKQIFAGEMLGWENSLGLSPYNKRFRTYRKNMSKIIGSKISAAQFNVLQEEEVGHFLLHLLNKPQDLIQHIKREAGSVILKIGYGYQAESHEEDHFVHMAGDAMERFARAGVPGAFMVDMLPFLKQLPEWMPGTGFQQTAREWGAQLSEVTEKPYAFVKHQMSQGSNRTSFLSQLLDAGDETPEEKFTNKWSAMSLYTAGADTTVSSIACFFLAMTVFPEVQKKAQEEIDRVVGKDRLPTLADRENLPYIEATVQEVLRWHPVAPMSLPHTSTEDDEYEGYFIPKGAMVFANVWHFTHDPAVYPDPMVFNPERFLKTESHEPAPDPHNYVFGYGRRICPGRLLADNALYLNVAQTLAAFSINTVMKDGKAVKPEVRFEPGVVSHPAPFQSDIQPRSPHHEQLIKDIVKTYPWRESDGKVLENMSF